MGLSEQNGIIMLFMAALCLSLHLLSPLQLEGRIDEAAGPDRCRHLEKQPLENVGAWIRLLTMQLCR